MVWFVVFAVTVFGLYFWREHRIQQREIESPSSPLRSGERFIGQVVTLEHAIRGGSARVRLGERNWQIRGPDLPAGSRVRITGVDGTILLVDRLPAD